MPSAKAIIVGIVALGLAGGAFLMFSGDSKPTPKKKVAAPIVEITLPPLPPPPPPPPPPPKEEPPEEQEQEMVEQEEVVEETPPEPEAPADEPAALGTGIAGDGPPDGFGLSGKGNGGGNGSGGSRRVGGGGRFDKSARIIVQSLSAELRRNPDTRNATFNVEAAIWVNEVGRVTRVKLKGSAGSSEVDQALREGLIGVQCSESLQPDLPMPIHTRLSGRKPN